MRVLYILLFLLSATINPTYAQNTTPAVNLDELVEELKIDHKIHYFLDNHDTDFNLLKSTPEDYFIKSDDDLNFGFLEKTLWLKIPIEHDVEHNKNWYFEIANPNIDYLKVYLAEEGQKNYISWELGDIFPFNARVINHRNFVVPFELKKDTQYNVYLKVYSSNGIHLPMKIYSSDAFLEYSLFSEMLYGLYFGIILIMVLYNLMIFFSLKDINYLLYVLPIVSNVIYFSSYSGHNYQYLHQWSPGLQKFVAPIAISLWIITSSIFTLSFLKVRNYSKYVYGALIGMITLGGLLFLFSFLGNYQTVMELSNKATSINALVLISSGIYIYRKGNKFARYFILAWAFFTLGILTHTLTTEGITPSNIITRNALAFGTIMEIMLLSLALSDKYKFIQEDTERIQDSLIQQQEQDRRTLERRVKERTRQLDKVSQETDRYTRKIEEAYGEIQSMNASLEKQNEEIESQKRELSKKNEKITASINYAQRIQKAILPSTQAIQHSFPESFILFKPKDIVSGDFYWHYDTPTHAFIAAIDCTGHGVPGAFMSMIGERLLKQIVVTDKTTDPGIILDHLNYYIKVELHKQVEGKGALKDGMDLCMCVYDKKNSLLTFAGAKNPLYYIEKDNFGHIKGDKFSIGSADTDTFEYTTHEVKITSPTDFYIATDGYQDQFGGPINRKIGGKKFRDLLEMIHKLPMQKQSMALEQFLERWMTGEGKTELQIDDILIIGFHLKP
ncbi:7TM diverse intracellular signaling domain-containing protein [Flammeovirga sp. EKP202]|uniref:7TM diverse intracellular signaling domain-containing protein n=1 Tax=Flammeovirga sp. EKP202 TaxID=2770592 RepID=UPI00165ED16B|nr:7TM diverse intracellular signaling domain-containing protein [Flammeovirga sp. EKP202]MBD0405225.1 SpoIIE family protein phosphatase [Flammeovirga sp. EKP202]